MFCMVEMRCVSCSHLMGLRQRDCFVQLVVYLQAAVWPVVNQASRPESEKGRSVLPASSHFPLRQFLLIESSLSVLIAAGRAPLSCGILKDVRDTEIGQEDKPRRTPPVFYYFPIRPSEARHFGFR